MQGACATCSRLHQPAQECQFLSVILAASQLFLISYLKTWRLVAKLLLYFQWSNLLFCFPLRLHPLHDRSEALSCAAQLRTPMLPGSSQHPPTGLHWHSVLQTFGEHQILASVGDEARAGSVETTKGGVHFFLGFQCPPGSS